MQVVLDDRRWRASPPVLAPPSAVLEGGEDAHALTAVVHPAADHLLPLGQPDWYVGLLSKVVRNGGRSPTTCSAAADLRRDRLAFTSA
jgi:hypothetical protein